MPVLISKMPKHKRFVKRRLRPTIIKPMMVEHHTPTMTSYGEHVPMTSYGEVEEPPIVEEQDSEADILEEENNNMFNMHSAIWVIIIILSIILLVSFLK